jgi:YegS/Rv2252/BmrU family lipid kinase
VAAIVNPAAGSGRGPRRWRTVEALLNKAGIRAETFVTATSGEGADAARHAAAAGIDTIVAVGGDGTVHEIVNGLADGNVVRPDVRLAVVPAGTGMDFARNLRLPRRPDLVAARVIAGRERAIDVGVAEEASHHLFVNFAETGLGAEVVAREARMSNLWPGRVSFLIAAMGASLRESNVEASVLVDGAMVYDGPLVSVVIANGQYFGGGMKIAPHAAVDDGSLDILVLGDFARAELVSQAWKLYPGSHLRHHKVRGLTGSTIAVLPKSTTRLDLDGELYGEGPYTFSVARSALRVIV